MTRPTVTRTAEEAYEGLGPWTTPDEVMDWHLLRFVDAVTRNLSGLNDLVRDTDEGPGWSSVFDVDAIQADALPWLAQFVGVTIDESLSDADKRQQIKDTSGFRRGTRASLVGAVKPYLIGTKAVAVTERDTSPYHFTVRTFGSETPDPDKVLAALLSQKPAGLVMDYEVIDGITYGELRDSLKTYSELSTEFDQYADMKNATSV